MATPMGEYPRNKTGVLTARDFNVVTANGKTIGFIQKVQFDYQRNVNARYEIGLSEISYLSPASVSTNDISIDKFLYTGAVGSYSQTNPTMLSDILSQNVPVNIDIMRYAGNYPGEQPSIFLRFSECWFKTYSLSIGSDNGNYAPIIESAKLSATWVEIPIS